MKKYKVVITDSAKAQLKEYISYILKELKNRQAAAAVRDDAAATKKSWRMLPGVWNH